MTFVGRMPKIIHMPRRYTPLHLPAGETILALPRGAKRMAAKFAEVAG